ncbi:Origin of replication complex subunit [Arachis hypogaea]|nr:Origin of replication complex subunit [Arachis hypogaea]
MGYVEPIPVYFPDYTDADLCKILSRNQADSKLYSSFLDVALRSFFRVTRQVDELSTAFKPLYEKYCEPLSDKRVFPNGDKDKDMKRKLFSHINPHITSSLNEIFKVSSHPSAEVENSKEANLKVNQKKPERREEIAKLDFHMSTSAKYLLILAFLASRNPATLDASLFDSKGGSDNRYRSTVSEDLALKLTAPLSSLLAFLCQNHPGSSARCPVSHVQGGSIKTAIQAGSALAFTSALIDFRGCNNWFNFWHHLGTVVATWNHVPRVERNVALPGLIRTLKMMGNYALTFVAIGGVYIGVKQLVQNARMKRDLVNGGVGVQLFWVTKVAFCSKLFISVRP